MMPLQALQPYARAARRAIRPSPEACELCRASLPAEHPHLADLEQRALVCACRACALLFEKPGAAQGRYRTVPDRVLAEPAWRPSEELWSRLEIPVRLAFLHKCSRLGRWLAFYPSPAGATECQLPLDAWESATADAALPRLAEPDVEALLFHGQRQRPLEVLLVPISSCYELVSEVRRHWRGLDGGDEVRARVAQLFSGLRARSRPVPPRSPQGGAP